VYTSILARALQWVKINFFQNVRKHIKYIENVLSTLGLLVMPDLRALSLASIPYLSALGLRAMPDPRDLGLEPM
jgi:hypothetical protein